MTALLDLQPTLTGAHIALRPLAAGDFDELWIWAGAIKRAVLFDVAVIRWPYTQRMCS